MNNVNGYTNIVSHLTSQVSSAASSSLVVQSNEQNAKTPFVFLGYLLELKIKSFLKFVDSNVLFLHQIKTDK